MKDNTEHRKSQEKSSLKQEWGKWLSNLASWDWFCTLTFRDRTPEQIKAGWTKVGTHYAARAFKAFVKAVQKETPEKIRWVCGLEYQHWRGVPHYHALLSGVQDVRRMDFVDWWWDRYGIARILPYKERASYYMSKYVIKDLGEIFFSNSLTKEDTCVTNVSRCQNANCKDEQGSLELCNGAGDKDR